MKDGDVIERLLVKKNLTLETAIEICRAEEAAKRYRGEITGDDSAKAAAVSQYRRQKQQATTKAKRHEKGKGQESKFNCFFCTRDHGPKDRCPARETTWAACGQKGHWAKSRQCKGAKYKSKWKKKETQMAA